MILFFKYGIGQTNLMPTRNRLISKNLQKKRAFEIYFISEVAETVAKRRKEGFSEDCDQQADFYRRPYFACVRTRNTHALFNGLNPIPFSPAKIFGGR
jgi:hypothetical protein